MPESASVTATIVQTVPVGTVVSNIFSLGDLPPGWLPCDGSTFNAAQYPLLFQKLGNSDVLPDLRGYFLRGLDPTGKVDPDGASRKPLSTQQDAFAEHSHVTYQAPFFDSEPFSGGNQYRTSEGPPYTNFRHQEPSSKEGGPETRPRNVAVNYLIFAGLPAAGATGGEASPASNDSDRGEAR